MNFWRHNRPCGLLGIWIYKPIRYLAVLNRTECKYIIINVLLFWIMTPKLFISSSLKDFSILASFSLLLRFSLTVNEHSLFFNIVFKLFGRYVCLLYNRLNSDNTQEMPLVWVQDFPENIALRWFVPEDDPPWVATIKKKISKIKWVDKKIGPPQNTPLNVLS
jgi:hypothetical protein